MSGTRNRGQLPREGKVDLSAAVTREVASRAALFILSCNSVSSPSPGGGGGVRLLQTGGVPHWSSFIFLNSSLP